MASEAQKNEFLRMIAPIAMAQAKKHDNKIFASVCIAQAIHESGWGTSAKMVKANALFGIKVGKSAYHFGTAWKDKAYKTGTTEFYDGKNPTKIVDFFRAYDNVSDATEDYFDMLCHCQRYRPALNQKSPQKCIEKIVAGGYATGPSYAEAIMNLIRGNDLTRFDAKEMPKINPYTLRSSMLQIRSKGESVKWLQWELNQREANLKEDGIYGNLTKLSVILYQKDHKLMADGICGPKTIASIKSGEK